MRWAAYHGIRGPNVDADSFTFGGISEYPEGIHLGSLDQARMRAGRGSTIEVTVGRDLIGAEGIKRV